MSVSSWPIVVGGSGGRHNVGGRGVLDRGCSRSPVTSWTIKMIEWGRGAGARHVGVYHGGFEG